MNKMCKAHGVPCDVYWHVDWNMVAHLPYFHERAVVTWIRDPVERLYSEWTYIRNVGAESQVQWDYTPAQQKAAQKATTLAEFVRIPGNPANNRMSRYLLGFHRPNLNCYHDCEARWTPFLTKGQEGPGQQMVSLQKRATKPQILTVIKHRLDHSIPLIGVTDCYDSSLALLGTQLGWNVPAMLADAKVHYRAGGSNKTATHTKSHRSELTPAVIQLIEQQNALDLQVYCTRRCWSTTV